MNKLLPVNIRNPPSALLPSKDRQSSSVYLKPANVFVGLPVCPNCEPPLAKFNDLIIFEIRTALHCGCPPVVLRMGLDKALFPQLLTTEAGAPSHQRAPTYHALYPCSNA